MYVTHQHWNIYPISVANRQLFFHYKILVITNWRRKNNNKKVTKIKSTSFIQTFVLIFKKRVYYGRLKKVFLKLLLEFCSGRIADVKSQRANVDEYLIYYFEFKITANICSLKLFCWQWGWKLWNCEMTLKMLYLLF